MTSPLPPRHSREELDDRIEALLTGRLNHLGAHFIAAEAVGVVVMQQSEIAELKRRLGMARCYIERHPYTCEDFEAAQAATDLSRPLEEA